VKRLIINADDFGLTGGVNRAIREAHENGILTSATLMANGAAFDDAVQVSRSAPRLSVGCHVVLVDGFPVLEPTSVSTLLDGKFSKFRQRLSKFAVLSLCGRLNEDEIEAEATAQIRKLQLAGILVSHLDTHKHTHIFPQVLRPLLRAAKNCGVPAIRNAFEPVRISLLAERPTLWKRLTQVKLLRSFAKAFRRSVKEAGILCPDGALSIAATGALDETLFRILLENLPEGTWEFVSHPGYNDAELQTVGTRLKESRAQELNILTSTVARDIVRSCEIELISYRDLALS
jgi:hopanoid biosynthesis associated protein HpnK